MKTQRDTTTRTRRIVSLILAVVGSIFFLAVTASAKTITVTGTGDTIALDGKVTLREAITAANKNVASGDAPAGDAGLDIIHFNIPGGAFQTITLTSELPPTPEPLTIDGTSQPGFAGTPVIELNGNNVADTGLFIYGGNSVVKGLVINRFKGIAILLSTKGLNFVVGNYIGTNASGTSALANGGDGVSIQASSSNNVIGGNGAFRNVISGNGGNGIGISSGSDNNTVQGNYIGINAAGTASLGNSGNGIRSFGANNIIGGSVAGARNVISGNSRGVSLEGVGATNNQVQGNFIGTNAAGTAALGNNQEGVTISGSGNFIGGTVAAAKNVISGNRFGVGIGGANNQVQGNFIGTDITGTAALGNSENGVSISGPNNLVGGAASGAGNLISGNSSNGVIISGSATASKIQGNLIGTDATGTIALGNGGYGVRIFTANNFIGGLLAGEPNVISGNYRGLTLEGASATGNQVQGNFIGTNSAGAALGNNQEGVTISGSGNVIGGTVAAAKNVISGNRTGVNISGANNQVQGNFIGTNAAGNAALGNSENGVAVSGPNNFIGGTASGAGNLISGNPFVGVIITGSTSTGNKIQGNLIGTDATGTFALGNSGEGVRVIDAPSTLVGGAVSGARNIISGNSRGVSIEGAATGSLIVGNYIGTDITGSNGLGNAQEGVELYSCSGNTIGGTIKGTRNVISGNGDDGVYITGGKMNLVQGNYIGTKADGVTALPNTGVGVDVYSSFSNTIGGTTATAANVIANSGYAGVLIQSGSGNALLGNSMVNNSRLGIDLDRTDVIGLLANDQGDPDPGANKRQNYPLLTSVTVNGGNTSIQGTLNSTPNKQFRVEFFANNKCGVSGFGEGQVFLGFASVTTDGNGDATINTTLPGAPAGQFITATATSPGDDTSEFSPCALIGGANPGVLQFESKFFIASEIDGTAKITVTRSNGMLGTVSVHYATSDGAATAPADYASTSGDLTFADGEVIKSFTVPLVNDGVPESQETFHLTLSAPTGGAALGANSASQLYINDYDPTYPETHISDASVVEGNSGTTNAVFHVTVTPHTKVVTVSYVTVDGTAQAGSDYQATSGTLTFNPGETSKDVPVPVIGDTQVEGDELFFVNLHTLSAGYVVKGQGEGTIIDDEGFATLSLSAATFSVNENGGSLDIHVKRVGGNGTATVDYATSDGSAASGSDYTAKTGTVTFSNNETDKVVSIPIVNDGQNEPDETFNFKLNNPGNAVLGSPNSSVITVIDDDAAQPAGTLAFSAAKYTVNESIGQITIIVKRTNGSSGAVSVQYTTSDATATSNSDYLTTSGTLNWADGDTSDKAFAVAITDDSSTEADETLNLTLSNPTGGAVVGAPTTAVLTISDNDAAPASSTIEVEQSTYSVSESEHYKPITITRTGDLSVAAAVDYATSDISATQHGDYNILLGTLNFASGESTKTLTLLVTDDSYVEGDETFSLTLSNPQGVTLGAQSVAQITITDNDNNQNAPNAIDEVQNFVRQHYHDFLNREPDAFGFKGWQDILNNCAAGDTKCDRIEVSSGFYRSPEFHDRGYFIYRFYAAVLGRHPHYEEFMRDMAKVSGFLSVQQQEEARQQFIIEFMARGEFKQKYQPIMSAEAYVDALAQTAGVTLTHRDQLVQQLQGNQISRGEALRAVIESIEVDQKFFNEAFVIMQYFGYLRRDADSLYVVWINILNQTGDYRVLVNGFMNSLEYRQRFGQ